MARLEQLTVANFRGASTRLQLDFEKSKSITVIFGENGTGKSTITDALDALGNAKPGSLEDRSSVKPKEHLPTIGKISRDIHIELKAGGKTWTATIDRNGIPSAPVPRPKIRVLRRAPLLNMVNAAPADRYEELKRFIDVQHVERAENALKDACTSAKQKVDRAVSQRDTAETQLREVWTKEGSPAPGPMEWAQSVAFADAASLDVKAKALRDASSAIRDAEQRLADFDAAMAKISEKQEEAVKVEEEVVLLPSPDVKAVVAITGLLRTASDFLAVGTHEDKCPVCEQGIPVEKLKADIQARLKELAPFEVMRTKQETAVKAVQVVQQAAVPQRDRLLVATRLLLPLLTKAELEPIAALKPTPSAFAELAKTEGFDADLSVHQARALIALLGPTRPALDTAEAAQRNKVGQITAVAALHKAYVTSVQETESLQATREALDKALGIARTTRITYTQAILDDVSGECNRLYSLIHPNEKVAITKLELDPDKRASLNQKADFQGHSDVTPQAYFSESHLDTLAFCFWLALTKREFPNKEAVLVLDDVFTSVDSQHITRIANLVVDESQHFAHVVVTTHQRLWRDFYRNPHGAGKRTQLVELQRWALAKGISSYKTKLAVTELADSLKATPFVRQATAAQAGILLENILDGLALHYRCRVARTPDGNYTLGELLDATASLFKKVEINSPVLDSAGQPMNPAQFTTFKPETIVGKIRELAFVRNQVGAHFNASGAEIADSDVEAFADLTVQLAEALRCPRCGQIPTRDTGSHLECSCPPTTAVRMSPLKV